MLKRAGVFSMLVVAATGQFPFTYEPLEESAHSNKVFINVKNIKEVAGVWKAINVVYHTYLNEGYLYDGVSQFNMSCEQALAGGWDYDYYIRYPRAATIEVDEYRREDGLLGHIFESRFAEIQRFGITDFSYLESIMTLDTGACRKMRPYFDWEVDKVMTLRSIRYYYYPDENGVTKHNELESCIYADVDHPQCFDTVFELDGQTHTGVVVDVPVFLECIAGPCLDLPFSIPGYSRTQGYVPPAAVEQSTPWTSNAGK